MTDDALVVLVHSPLVGPVTWQPVADVLARRGLTVVVPHLDNPDDPDDRAVPLYHHHAERVRRDVEARSRTAPVILVGHSGAGALLPVIGDTLVNEVAAYVFVDSDLPRDRASRMDGAPPEFAARLGELTEGGHVQPWSAWWQEDVLAALLPEETMREAFTSQLRPLPRRLFDERIPVPPEWPDAPCGYLRLSGAYDDAAARAHRQGWPVQAVDAGHLHMLVDPEGTAHLLLDLVARMGAGEGGDPVLATRARVGTWVEWGRRAGFGALALAVTLFAVALYWDLPEALVTVIVVCLAVACLTLLPSIVLGYGIAAAEREDRERGV